MNTSTILQTILNKGRHLLLCLMLLTIGINHIQAEEQKQTWDLTTTSYSAASETQVTWSATDVNMVLDQNVSTYPANENLGNGTETRFYKNQKITFIPANGVTITNITLTAIKKEYGDKFTSSTWENATATNNDSKIVTIIPTNGASPISCIVSAAAWATSVTVTYTRTSGGGETPEPDPDPDPEPDPDPTPDAPSVTFIATEDFAYNNTERGKGSITKSPIEITYLDGIFGDVNKNYYQVYKGYGITFTAENNYKISKIVLTSTANNTSDYGPGHLTHDGYTYEGKIGTWIGNAQSITLAANYAVRMTQITVYYTEDDRAEANLSWSTDAVELLVGAPFTAPTLNNPNALTGITFTSNNESLATVSNTGAITLLPDVAGTATIIATYAGNETHKDAEVSCTITVNPIIENVVILAQYDGKYYAMKAEYVDDTKQNTLRAVEVEIINGIIYYVDDEASITWECSIEGNTATFKNGTNYLKGIASSAELTLNNNACQWTYDGNLYTIGNRTFLYYTDGNTSGFKNYATSNAGNKGYSTLPVVTPAKIENATITKRENTTVGHYGTICMPYNIPNYTGATFYEVAGKEDNKIIFDQVTELEAGMPYIFLAEAAEIKLVQGNETVAEPKSHNGLVGSFTQIDPAENNALTGNYIVYQNVIQKCGQNCGMLANRAYFSASDLEALTQAPAPVQGRRRVTMNKADETTTAVDNITENGTIAPAMQGTYDIMGRSITEPAASGFYIINGKKVFVVK